MTELSVNLTEYQLVDADWQDSSLSNQKLYLPSVKDHLSRPSMAMTPLLVFKAKFQWFRSSASV